MIFSVCVRYNYFSSSLHEIPAPGNKTMCVLNWFNLRLTTFQVRVLISHLAVPSDTKYMFDTAHSYQSLF